MSERAMQTASEWHQELHKRCPDLMSVNFLNPVPITSGIIETFVEDIQKEARLDGRRKTLVEAAKAVCWRCHLEHPKYTGLVWKHGHSEEDNRLGWDCGAGNIHDLIAKHDAEAGNGEATRADCERETNAD